MANYSTSQFKNGLKLIIDDHPYLIVTNEIVKPGKGQAFNRVKFKDLITGKLLIKTLKSGELFPVADILELNIQYLYNDSEVWHFMHPELFEQYTINDDVMPDSKNYLVEQDLCAAILWNDELISVTPANHVVLQVVQTDPGLKGDTVSSGGKLAIMHTGVAIQVPLFINIDDKVKVDTRTHEYIGRI